jgi:hypothetical protein
MKQILLIFIIGIFLVGLVSASPVYMGNYTTGKVIVGAVTNNGIIDYTDLVCESTTRVCSVKVVQWNTTISFGVSNISQKTIQKNIHYALNKVSKTLKDYSNYNSVVIGQADLTSGNSTLDVKTIFTEQIVTKSQVALVAGKYFGYFNNSLMYNKTTHPCMKVINGKQYLDMECRNVMVEGYNLCDAKCLQIATSYSTYKGCRITC